MSDPEDNARMNIDGSDVRLNLVKRVAPANEKVGRHSTEIYQAPGIKVTARYVIMLRLVDGYAFIPRYR